MAFFSLQNRVYCWYSRHRAPYAIPASRPTIVATIGGRLRVFGLLDSGCDICMLTRDYASLAGIEDIESGQKLQIDAGADKLTAHKHEMRLGINDVEFTCPVVIVDTHAIAKLGTPLIIGREVVFSKLGPITFYEDADSQEKFMFFG